MVSKLSWFIIIVGLFAACSALAQGPGYGWWGPGGGPGWWGADGSWPGLDSMTTSLDLTDAQRQKAQAIFDSAYKSTQTLRDQMLANRSAYWNSGRPITDAEIDKLATERGELIAKMQSVHDKAFANFYNNVLTKEQRGKFDQLQASAGPGPGWGRCWRRNWTR